jgi:hypothetical protein
VSKLPLTVTAVDPQPGGLYRVTVAYNDLSTGNFLIPWNLATLQAVTIAAAALAELLEPALTFRTSGARPHRRYAPRT